MAVHFILQRTVNKIVMKLKCFACKIERNFFHAMHIVPEEVIISAYGLVSRVYWDLEKKLAMNKAQPKKPKTILTQI